MTLLASLLVAATFDGSAANAHAARLSSLGPHPWGGPRALAAAQYVEAQFHSAGLGDAHLEDFDVGGVRGHNVVGTLSGDSPDFLVLAAHHDSPAESRGVEDGAGVAILIETARVLAQGPRPSRTIVFVSFDGDASGEGPSAGSGAYVRRRGVDVRRLTAALILDRAGFRSGETTLQALPCVDPLRPGKYAAAPAWLIRAAWGGAREIGARVHLVDPVLSSLYQPAVRSFRFARPGDDQSFLQAGLASIRITDEPLFSRGSRPRNGGDPALNPRALERTGRAVVALCESLAAARAGRARDAHWFGVGGLLLGEGTLWVFGLLSLTPSLWRASRGRGVEMVLRLAEAAVFLVLLWRNPVPILWIFALPHLAIAASAGRAILALSFLPAMALVAAGVHGYARRLVAGSWFAPWELLLMAIGLGLVIFFNRPPRAKPAKTRTKGGRRRGLRRRERE